MKRLIYQVGVGLGVVVCLFSGFGGLAAAHSLDETFVEVYLNTGRDRRTLAKNKLELVVYISWPQLSYIHEKRYGAKIDASGFDDQLDKLLAKPAAHRDFIGENVEVKSGDWDCDLTSFKELPLDKKQILIGKGVGVSVEVTCPDKIVFPVRLTNRMFLDEFGHQLHEVEFYSYNKLVSKAVLNREVQTAVYPVEPTLPAPEETEEAGIAEKKNGLVMRSGWIGGALVVGLGSLFYFRKKLKKIFDLV